jgi:hypothetical protein
VVKAADHEDESGFKKLLDQRATLRGKVEAMEFRVAVARESLTAAQARARDTQVEAWRTELEQLRGQVIAADSVAYDLMYRVRRDLRKLVAEQNDRVLRAQTLDQQIHAATGEPLAPHQGIGTFGSGWANLSAEDEYLLQAATGMVHQNDAEDRAASVRRFEDEMRYARPPRPRVRTTAPALTVPRAPEPTPTSTDEIGAVGLRSF